MGLLTFFLLVLAALAAGAESSARVQPSMTHPLSTPAADRKLRQALEQGDLELLNVAIAGGADVNGRSTNGLTPLQELLRAATAPLDRERRECVACLLAHGAEVSGEDRDRRTPVIYATRMGDLDTLRLLVEAEAYVRARDRFHKTALFYAVEADRRDIVVYLVQNGALISLSVKEKKLLGLR